jgi:predicted nucleic acid-binding protein
VSAERANYVDASALVKLAVREPESAALRRYMARRRPLASSALARTEVVRALLPLEPEAVRRGKELDPDNEPGPRSLDRAVVLRALEERLTALPGTVARIARELVGRIRDLTRTIDALVVAFDAMELVPSAVSKEIADFDAAGPVVGCATARPGPASRAPCFTG